MEAAYQQYSFKGFIESVKDMNYHDIIPYAEQEIYQIERVSYGVKGAIHRRQMGSVIYVHQLKEFLFWMRYGIHPSTVTEENYQLYRIVAENLVSKGQFKPSILKEFSR